METVGVYLKRERESKNLSLREVARLTKISELYLDCIEKDDYQIIPKGPYVKGYISAYSRMIGVDTDQALALYESANEKKDLADAVPVEIPPATGWKTAVASAFTSLTDWVDQIKNRFHRSPVQDTDRNTSPDASASTALSEKRDESADVAPSHEAAPPTSDNAEDRQETSVLIPFRKFAQPSQVSEATAPAPSPVNKSQRISPEVSTLPKETQIVNFLKALWVRLITPFLDRAAKGWPRPSHDLWVALIALLLGVTILVFSGIGVYHVFFFDKQAPTAALTTPVAEQDTAPPLSPLPPQPAVPHKTSRLKKPDSPLPTVITVTPAPPEKRPTPPSQAADQIKAAPGQSNLRPEKASEPVIVTKAEATPPADPTIKVLKATICTSIQDRMPSGIDTTFPLSTQRIYVWSHVQTEHYPTTIRHIYYHEGQIVNEVMLNVRAPFWRTWSLKNIDKDGYRGHWRVDITTDDGRVLRRLYFDIN